MIFHEIYGCYYLSVEKIIHSAINKTLDYETMLTIIQSYAYQESSIEITQHIKDQSWPLLKSDYTTPLCHSHHRPLTILEKRWLKSLSLDPRIQLFSVSFEALKDIEPLITPEDYVIYDQYSDGDPFQDQSYINNFQTILYAIDHQFALNIQYQNKTITCLPAKIEYSLKDNKFRLKTYNDHIYRTLNIAKITQCDLGEHFQLEHKQLHSSRHQVTLELYNKRNTLERVLMQFADLQKQVKQIDDNTYHLQIFYQKEDETEIIIRILSFGPMLQVIAPQKFIGCIKDRLSMQLSCELR